MVRAKKRFLDMMNLKKQLRRLVIPIFVELALVMMLGATDTIMLSRHSDNAVAAVGFDNQIISLVFLVYQFMSMGAGILCSQYFGAGLRKRLVQVVGIALMLNFVMGAAVSSLLYFYAPSILTAMDLNEDLMADALIYLQITGSLSFVQALAFTFSASLRSVDKVMYPMIVTALVNVLNIFGNYVLIFGRFGCPALGVEGAAISTAICRTVGLLALTYFHFNKHIPRFPLEYFRPFPWRELKNLVHIGIPAMSEELSYCMSQIVITLFINQLGTEALATRTYCWNILMFAILFCCSVTQGGEILEGHLVGAGKQRVAYALGNYFYKWSMRITLSLAVVLASCSTLILGALTDNQEIVRAGMWIFIIDCFLEFGRVTNIFACGTLRAAGDAVFPVIVGVIVQWSVAVGMAYVLGIHLGFGIIGIWLAFCMDENLRGVILIRRWHRRKWQTKSFVGRGETLEEPAPVVAV